MNILIRSGVLAALAGAGVGLAHADVVTTTGGIKVVSSNGDFSAAVGTLLQFDAYEDQNDSSSSFRSRQKPACFRYSRSSRNFPARTAPE